MTRSPLRRLSAGWLAVALLLSGCPHKDSPEDRAAESRLFQHAPPAVPGASRRFEGTTLHYYANSLGRGAELDRALVARFREDTGIRVRVESRTQSTHAMFAEYQSLLKARRTDVDVLMLDVIWSGALAPNLVDLAPALQQAADKCFPNIVRNNTINGKLVAMPYYADAGLLFYRTDLLKQHGYSAPPATWEALEAMAAKIQAAERSKLPGFWGYVWEGACYEGLACNALEWQVSHGGDEIFHSDTGLANVANPAALAAFKRAAGWVGTISPPAVLSYEEEDARKAFQAGKAAFMRNWPYAYAAANAADSPVRGRFDVAMLPRAEAYERGSATLGGWQLGVSAYSPRREAAIALVAYLSSPEVQKWRAIEGAYPPSMRRVYEDPDVLRAAPFMHALPAVLDSAVARPSSRTGEAYERVSDIYARGVSEILHGAPAERIGQRMQGQLQTLIK